MVDSPKIIKYFLLHSSLTICNKLHFLFDQDNLIYFHIVVSYMILVYFK